MTLLEEGVTARLGASLPAVSTHHSITLLEQVRLGKAAQRPVSPYLPLGSAEDEGQGVQFMGMGSTWQELQEPACLPSMQTELRL